MTRLFAVALIVSIWLVAPITAAAQTETIEYYGLDALGSVRVIFDANGQQIDRMDYGPFGENLKAAIKFSFEQYAQLARDTETGHDYAEARNYSPGLGRFNRVDPVYSGLFDPQKWNRYIYAANNPLRFTDTTGMDPDEVTSQPCPHDPSKRCVNVDGKKAKTDQPKEADDGLVNSILEKFEDMRFKALAALLGNNEQGSGAGVGPVRLGLEWLTGFGPNDREFGDGDSLTEQLKQHAHIENVRKGIAANCVNASAVRANYSLAGLRGIPKYAKDYSSLATLGATGNLTATFLGSYQMRYDVSGAETGTATVHFTVTNPSALGSALRPPGLGYTEFWRENVADNITAAADWVGGPLSSTQQKITWTETVSCGGQ